MKRIALFLLILGLSGCATVPIQPLPPPPGPQPWTLQVTVRGANSELLTNATGSVAMGEPNVAPVACLNGGSGTLGRLACFMPATSSDTWGGTLTVSAPLYVTSTVQLIQPDENQPDIYLTLKPVLPAPPSRSAALGLRLTFQGLSVTTAQYGTLTWFEPFLGALSALSDRQAVYAAKHGAGDTHAIIECFTHTQPVYNEAPYQGIIQQSCEQNQGAFLALVEEIIQNGFIPVIAYDGDDGDNAVDGYPNAARQAPILAALLAGNADGDLNPYVVYARLWDSVFYGSSPANITAFGSLFRSILPNGYLAIEFNIGHIPLGGGPSDYSSTGAMANYDLILAEYPNWPTTGDAVWQINARMLGPSYKRPPDQPSTDDPNPPYYLAQLSSRGPFVFSCFEWGEYPWTHGQLTAAQAAQGALYYKAMGCPFSMGPSLP